MLRTDPVRPSRSRKCGHGQDATGKWNERREVTKHKKQPDKRTDTVSPELRSVLPPASSAGKLSFLVVGPEARAINSTYRGNTVSLFPTRDPGRRSEVCLAHLPSASAPGLHQPAPQPRAAVPVVPTGLSPYSMPHCAPCILLPSSDITLLPCTDTPLSPQRDESPAALR